MSTCGDVKKVFVPNKGQEKTETIETIETIKGIKIEDVSAEKIIQFLEAEGKSPSEYGLWVAVKKDGCSGHSYDMDLREIQPSIDKKDKIFEHNGATVMVDRASYLFVIGSILGYTEALTGSGFSFSNPNIKKTCSCGVSFAV